MERVRSAAVAAEQARREVDEARRQVEEAQRQAGVALSEAQAKLTEVLGTATQALSASTKITDEQGVIAAKSAHIEDAKLHADRVRAELDRALVAAEQQRTEAEGLRARAQSAADDAATLLLDVGTAKGTAEQTADALKLQLATAKDHAAQTKALADKAEIVEKRVTGYEQRLAELENTSKEQLKVIVGLLPGATSAGLASAFDKRKETFLKPHSGWQKIFVWSVIAIVVIAGSGLVQMYSLKTWPTWDVLFRLWVARLPVAGALARFWYIRHAIPAREATRKPLHLTHDLLPTPSTYPIAGDPEVISRR